MRKVLELAGIVLLGLLIWITYDALAGPDRLPDRVATHFDAAGNANAWGPPTGMIIMPIIAAGIYLVMSIASRAPDAFNFPVRVTQANLPRLQAVALSMLAWIKVEIAALFATLQWAFIQSARSGEGHLLPRILPISLVVIFGTAGWHLFALFRAARPVPEKRSRPSVQ